MRIRSWLAAALSTLMLVALMSGVAPAQATPPLRGASCPALAPGSLRTLATGSLRTMSSGYNCLDHGQLFDPTPVVTDVEVGQTIAISGDGTRAVWARAEADPSPSCGDPAVGQRLAIYPGLVTAKNTTWLAPFYVSLGCRFLDPGMSLALNLNGTSAGIVFSDSLGTSAKSIYYAVFSWPLSGNLDGVAFRTLATSAADDTPSGLKATAARTGKTFFFSGGFDKVTGTDTSNFAIYNYQTATRTEWSIPELLMDSGSSASGTTTFAVTRADAGTQWASSNLKVYVCRSVTATCTFDIYKISNQDANTQALAAINDAGTELAISWTSMFGRFWRHLASALPLTPSLGATIDAPVNVHVVANDDTNNQDPLAVFMSPAGTRMWVGGLDRGSARTYALSASINKYTLTWSDPNINTMNLPVSFRDVEFQVSRNGRVVTTMTSDDLQMGVISIADGNTGQSSWEHSYISPSPSVTPYVFNISMSDDGSRYVNSFLAWNATPRPLATSGLFLPFQYVKKAPVVTGAHKVGSKLSVSAGTWSVAGGRLSYQWLIDGAWIAGATRSSYTLTNADAGHAVTVAVTRTKSNYYNRLLYAGSTAIVTHGRITASTPVIQGYYVGHPHADQTLLSVDVSSWGPGVPTFRYVWKVNGVTKGTDATYTPTVADIDKTITVTVTASKPGFNTVSKTSAPSPLVFAQVGLG